MPYMRSKARRFADMLSSSGVLKAENVPTNLVTTDQLKSALPIGSILAYVGLLADVPNGWAVCDGTNGTPDLTDSFVMGGTQAQNGQTGGTNTIAPQGSVSSSLSGDISVNNHTLSSSQVPSHGHEYWGGSKNFNANTRVNVWYNLQYIDNTYGHTSSHSLRHTTPTSGGSGAHNHGASHNLSVNSSLNLSSQDNKPKYYKTAYIMRVS